MNAYSKEYLEQTMENLGEAMDFAVNSLQLSLDQFMSFFIASHVAEFFQQGNPKFINMSGTELVLEVLMKCGNGTVFSGTKPTDDYERSSEYWTGWVLAYYQWYSGKTFEYIQKYLPASEINNMYHPLHEAPEQKFLESADKIIASRDVKSTLQELRKKSGLTQKDLSEKSGVNIRTIQQYENLSKDIHKAAGNILLALAKTLNCRIEDLIV